MNHILCAAFAVATLCGAASAVAGADGDTAPRYDVLDPLACEMPPARPPPQRKDSHAAYNIERRFMDLDGSGQCVMMEVWIARLGGSDSPGMRTLEHRFLRFSGGKWRRFETSLAYFPQVLRARRDQARILMVAPIEDELGDSIVFASIAQGAFVVAGWTDGGNWLDLQPADERSEDVRQALAAAGRK